MKKIKILLVSLLLISCDQMEFKKGEKLCVLNKKVEIRIVDRINQRYECRYVDNNGVIQNVIVLRSEAKLNCNEENF